MRSDFSFNTLKFLAIQIRVNNKPKIWLTFDYTKTKLIFNLDAINGECVYICKYITRTRQTFDSCKNFIVSASKVCYTFKAYIFNWLSEFIMRI